MTETRGIRNNNPGNIRKGDAWAGLADIQPDEAFCAFSEPKYGIRAIAKILLKYAEREWNTPALIIHHWAPPSENDTTAYVNGVCQSCMVEPTSVLDLRNFGTMRSLVMAIIKHENGKQPYTDDVINDGILMAGVAPVSHPFS